MQGHSEGAAREPPHRQGVVLAALLVALLAILLAVGRAAAGFSILAAAAAAAGRKSGGRHGGGRHGGVRGVGGGGVGEVEQAPRGIAVAGEDRERKPARKKIPRRANDAAHP